MTKILACKCTHAFQDKEYGRGMRVHNLAKKEGNVKGWRCTVCENIKEVQKGDLKKGRDVQD